MGLVLQIALGIVLGFVLLEFLPYIVVFGVFTALLAVALVLILAIGFWVGWSKVAMFLGAWAVLFVAVAAKGRLEKWLAVPRRAERIQRFKVRWQRQIEAADRGFGWVYLFCLWLYTAPFYGGLVFLGFSAVILGLSKIGVLPPEAAKSEATLLPVGVVSAIVGAGYAIVLARRAAIARRSTAQTL